jgi:hypothetical protein
MTREQATALAPFTPLYIVVGTLGTKPRIITAEFKKVTHMTWRTDPTKPYVEVAGLSLCYPTDRVHLTRNAALADLANLIRTRIAALTAELTQIEGTDR